MDYRGLPKPPEQAAEDSWDVASQLFPNWAAAWGELADWERDRWRLITSAARQAPAEPLGQGDEIRCSAGLHIRRMVYGVAELPHAEHPDGTRCDHRIYRDGVLVYDGVVL